MMVDIPPLALKIVYTILMLSVSAYMFGSQSPIEAHSNEDNTDFQVNGATPSSSTTTTITDSHGNVFKYPSVKISPVGAVLTSIGGAICGAIGVGIGEVILPQLLNQGVPIAVAAATSTLVVTLTCAVSAGVQVSALVAAGGVNAIPWSLVMYIVPGDKSCHLSTQLLVSKHCDITPCCCGPCCDIPLVIPPSSPQHTQFATHFMPSNPQCKGSEM